MFRGDGAPIALLLAWIKHDLWYMPEDSAAYKSAKLWADGATCEHTECSTCNADCDNQVWGPVTKDGWGTCGCGHAASDHVVATYDWKEWRDMMCHVLGINPEVFVEMLKGKR